MRNQSRRISIARYIWEDRITHSLFSEPCVVLELVFKIAYPFAGWFLPPAYTRARVYIHVENQQYFSTKIWSWTRLRCRWGFPFYSSCRAWESRRKTRVVLSVEMSTNDQYYATMTRWHFKSRNSRVVFSRFWLTEWGRNEPYLSMKCGKGCTGIKQAYDKHLFWCAEVCEHT